MSEAGSNDATSGDGVALPDSGPVVDNDDSGCSVAGQSDAPAGLLFVLILGLAIRRRIQTIPRSY
jgi:MYXO-CTERM domain-containing protein